jgi:hypothetical protein
MRKSQVPGPLIIMVSMESDRGGPLRRRSFATGEAGERGFDWRGGIAFIAN